MRGSEKNCSRKILAAPDRQGGAMVELAIMTPVFLLLIFACFEFIRLNMIRNLVQDAAYFAARDAMVPGATVDEAEEAAEQILDYMNTKGAEISINQGGSLNDDSDTVTVTITVPVADNSFLIPNFSNAMEFTSTATMHTERYHGYYEPD
ncbi:MAG: TadE family protein [Planctomycetota bacterium]|nr:TadE family protein [Planctomycetota bacterium]